MNNYSNSSCAPLNINNLVDYSESCKNFLFKIIFSRNQAREYKKRKVLTSYSHNEHIKKDAEPWKIL